MNITKHRLDITWDKAFDEIYCHHASLFIPFSQESLFDVPELIKVGITVRHNTVKVRKIISTSCRDIEKFLPCIQTEGGLIVKMNDSQLIDAISLNSWTTRKNGKRGTQKEFPTRLFYAIGDKEPVELPFSPDATPYLSSEGQFSQLSNGGKLEASIIFD